MSRLARSSRLPPRTVVRDSMLIALASLGGPAPRQGWREVRLEATTRLRQCQARNGRGAAAAGTHLRRGAPWTSSESDRVDTGGARRAPRSFRHLEAATLTLLAPAGSRGASMFRVALRPLGVRALRA